MTSSPTGKKSKHTTATTTDTTATPPATATLPTTATSPTTPTPTAIDPATPATATPATESPFPVLPDVRNIPADEMNSLNALSNQRLAYIHTAQEDLQKVRTHFHLPADAYIPTNYARFLTHYIRPDVQLGLFKQRPDLRDLSLHHLDTLTRRLANVLARITIRHRTLGRCGTDPVAHVGRDRFDDFVRYYLEYLREDEERIVRKMMAECKDGAYVPMPRDHTGVPIGVDDEVALLWEWENRQDDGAAEQDEGPVGQDEGVAKQHAAAETNGPSAGSVGVGANGSGTGVIEARASEEEKDGLEYLLM